MFYLDGRWRLIHVPSIREVTSSDANEAPEAGSENHEDENADRTLHLCSDVEGDDLFPPLLAKYEEINDELAKEDRMKAEISISRDGLAALVAGLGICKNLLHLNLKECNLTEKSVPAINGLLQCCKSLITLVLDKNPLGDVSLETLMFKTMCVEALSLKSVGITDVGLPLLLKDVEQSKRLNHLDLTGNVFTQELLQELLPGFVKEHNLIWFILLDIVPEEGWGKDYDKFIGKNQKKGKKKFKKFKLFTFE